MATLKGIPALRSVVTVILLTVQEISALACLPNVGLHKPKHYSVYLQL